MLGLALMASSAMSAAGMAPDELRPNRPNDVMNINDRFWLLCATSEIVSIRTDSTEIEAIIGGAMMNVDLIRLLNQPVL